MMQSHQGCIFCIFHSDLSLNLNQITHKALLSKPNKSGIIYVPFIVFTS